MSPHPVRGVWRFDELYENYGIGSHKPKVKNWKGNSDCWAYKVPECVCDGHSQYTTMVQGIPEGVTERMLIEKIAESFGEIEAWCLDRSNHDQKFVTRMALLKFPTTNQVNEALCACELGGGFRIGRDSRTVIRMLPCLLEMLAPAYGHGRDQLHLAIRRKGGQVMQHLVTSAKKQCVTHGSMTR